MVELPATLDEKLDLVTRYIRDIRRVGRKLGEGGVPFPELQALYELAEVFQSHEADEDLFGIRHQLWTTVKHTYRVIAPCGLGGDGPRWSTVQDLLNEADLLAKEVGNSKRAVKRLRSRPHPHDPEVVLAHTTHSHTHWHTHTHSHPPPHVFTPSSESVSPHSRLAAAAARPVLFRSAHSWPSSSADVSHTSSASRASPQIRAERVEVTPPASRLDDRDSWSMRGFSDFPPSKRQRIEMPAPSSMRPIPPTTASTSSERLGKAVGTPPAPSPLPPSPQRSIWPRDDTAFPPLRAHASTIGASPYDRPPPPYPTLPPLESAHPALPRRSPPHFSSHRLSISNLSETSNSRSQSRASQGERPESRSQSPLPAPRARAAMSLPTLSEVYSHSHSHDTFPANRRGGVYERPSSPNRERERGDGEAKGRGRDYRLDLADQRSPRAYERDREAREEREAERHFDSSPYQERVKVATVERQ